MTYTVSGGALNSAQPSAMTLSATDMTFLLVLFAAFPFVFFATEMTLSAKDMTFVFVFSACVVCCIYVFFAT